MNISYKWLKDYLDFDLSPEATAEKITMAGLEVEAIEKFESVKGGLSGLIIGLVTSVEKHADADKLSVTKVSVGSGPDLQIVCGAPNVRAGQKVIVATEGTLLHPYEGDAFKIKKAKIRGVASEGMICAADEIGWSNDHEGIMVLNDEAPVGMAVRDYLQVINDDIFQIGLTPNRGDAMSHLGVARDLAAVLSVEKNALLPLQIPSVAHFAAGDESLKIEVEVENSIACPRFSGLTISGINVKPSPDWLKNKLVTIGLRPINNIVDITNFVMHECGQPLHAYDATEITGNKISVKTLPQGTPFRTLDDKEIKLQAGDLMVCAAGETKSSQALPMCIAGVYGGLHSGVKENTTSIFLESACWNPQWIRRTSTYHNLRTDAASRFEKGVDPNGNIYALKRAAMLIVQLAGGKISSEIVDIYPAPVMERHIDLTWEKLHRIAGIDIPVNTVLTILRALSFNVLHDDGAQLTLSVPTFKTDVLRTEDVIEELLRIYGFDKIPVPDAVRSSLSFSGHNEREIMTESLSASLAGAGFREMMNNSISNSKYHTTWLESSSGSLVSLLSYSNIGLDSMRTSLLFPGLEVIRYNHNRKMFDLKLFEFGKTYRKHVDSFAESYRLILMVTGQLADESWKGPQHPADFFFVKGMVNNLLRLCGITKFSFDLHQDAVWENAMTYQVGKTQVATFGKVPENVAAAFDIKRTVYYADIDADALLRLKGIQVKYSPLPKFPSVRRDLALILDHSITFGEVEKIAARLSGSLLKSMNLFDVYADERIGAGKKSYAVSFVFIDEEKTLTDATIDKVMDKMIQQFQSELKAQIRS